MPLRFNAEISEFINNLNAFLSNNFFQLEMDLVSLFICDNVLMNMVNLRQIENKKNCYKKDTIS